MQAVIPAAGKGTRLGTLTDDRPKALVEVAGEPLLAHCLRALRPLEPDEVVVVVGYRGSQIREAFGASFEGLRLTYARQPEPLGLADAFLAAADELRGPFVSLNGDNVFRADLRPAVGRFRRGGVEAVVVTEEVPPGEARQGVCLVDGPGRTTGADADIAGAGANNEDKEARLRRVVEYPGPEERREGRVMTGFGVYSPAVLDACRRVDPSEAEEYELADALNLLVEEGATLATVPLEGRRVNVNTPEDLERAERLLAG